MYRFSNEHKITFYLGGGEPLKKVLKNEKTFFKSLV